MRSRCRLRSVSVLTASTTHILTAKTLQTAQTELKQIDIIARFTTEFAFYRLELRGENQKKYLR